MKSTEFITEKEIKPYQSEVLDVDRAVAALNQHCSKSIVMAQYPLWRGMKNHTEEIIVIDPSTGERQSQNTSNHYTQLIDNSPYYAGWPKRSKSLVCSSGFTYASAFMPSSSVFDDGPVTGGTYAIFPFDGVKIAVCPRKDLWDTPVALPRIGADYGTAFNPFDNLNDFNYLLRARFQLPADYTGMLARTQTSEFSSDLISFQSLRNVKNPISAEDFIPYIQKAMSPKATGMKLMSASQYASYKPANRECWVGGPVIAIRRDMFDKFLSAINQRKTV